MKIKSPLAVLLSIAALALSAIPARASLILPGPPLTGSVVAWDNAGLQFTALRSARLQSFTFENQGQADVIWLTDASGEILHTYSVPANSRKLTIEVDWRLERGTTYQLIADQPHNGRFADFRDFPLANADLRINSSVGRDTLESRYWFSFTNLTTLATPEPGAWSLLVLITPWLLRRRSM